MKKISLLLFTAIFCNFGLFANGTQVLATVDVQRVLNDYDTFQAAVEGIKQSIAPVEEEIKKMQENLQEIVTKGRELQAEVENPSINEERRKEAEAEVLKLGKQLQSLQLEIQQFRQQAQQLAKQGQQEDLAPLQQEALDVVKQVAMDKGIDLVIPLNVIVFSSEELEITDAVIAILNASE